MATFTLTGRANDLVGDGPTRTMRGYVEPSQPVINDAATNTQHYGNKALVFDESGNWSVTLIGTGDLVAAYRVVIEYVDDTPGSTAKLQRKTSNYFTLTANTEFGSKVDVDVVAVTTETLDSIYEARDEAEAAAAAAQAVGTTNDTIIAGRVNDPASATRTALSATFAPMIDDALEPLQREVSLATYLPLGNTGSGVVAAAFAAAATAAGPGGTVFVPKYMGTYVLDAAVTLDRVGLNSDGATISVPAALGSGVAAITVTASTGAIASPTVNGFRLIGPGPRSLGVKTANCDGLKITGQAKPFISDVEIQQFDSGEVLANDVGHIYHRNLTLTNNYYGVYCTKNTFDYYYTDSIINGNTFANFATPADQGFAALHLLKVHCGFAPYGIYQEPTPANQGKPKVFLQDCLFEFVRFEAIGNAAILTDAQQDGSNASITSDLTIRSPGFSWNATYKIAARDKDYAVVLSQTDRRIEIIMGTTGFTAGTVGVYRVKLGGTQAVMLVGSTTQVATTQVTTDSGGSNVTAFAAPVASGSSPSFAQIDVTSGNYVRWNAASVRFGGDASSLYADIASAGNFTWRNSSSTYAIIGRVTVGGLTMPKFALGVAGATTGPSWNFGTGSPEGVVTAPVGSLYSRTDGGAATSLYVKETGAATNAGWVAK